MTEQMYAIYDSKALAYLQPFFCKNDAVAIRLVQLSAQAEDHPFRLHAADFTLFHIGTWDDDGGQIRLTEAKRNLGTALELLAITTGDNNAT